METVYVIHICFTCDTQIIFAGCIWIIFLHICLCQFYSLTVRASCCIDRTADLNYRWCRMNDHQTSIRTHAKNNPHMTGHTYHVTRCKCSTGNFSVRSKTFVGQISRESGRCWTVCRFFLIWFRIICIIDSPADQTGTVQTILILISMFRIIIRSSLLVIELFPLRVHTDTQSVSVCPGVMTATPYIQGVTYRLNHCFQKLGQSPNRLTFCSRCFSICSDFNTADDCTYRHGATAVKIILWTVNILPVRQHGTAAVHIIFTSTNGCPACCHLTGRRIQIIPGTSDFLPACQHGTAAVHIIPVTAQLQPAYCHGSTACIQIILGSADVLETCQHLSVTRQIIPGCIQF